MKKAIILLGIILSIIFVTRCYNNSHIVGNTDDEILEYLYKSDFIKSIGLGVTNFIAMYNLNKGLEHSDYAYIVISNGNIVSNVEMSINGHIFNESMETGKPSMILLNDVMPKSEYKDGVTFDCRYFDINNNELKNDEEY